LDLPACCKRAITLATYSPSLTRNPVKSFHEKETGNRRVFEQTINCSHISRSEAVSKNELENVTETIASIMLLYPFQAQEQLTLVIQRKLARKANFMASASDLPEDRTLQNTLFPRRFMSLNRTGHTLFEPMAGTK
jgi:hypothetical protein